LPGKKVVVSCAVIVETVAIAANGKRFGYVRSDGEIGIREMDLRGEEAWDDSPAALARGRAVECAAAGPHHGDKCSGGRVQAPNAQFTRECPVCFGTGGRPLGVAATGKADQAYSARDCPRCLGETCLVCEKMKQCCVCTNLDDAEQMTRAIQAIHMPGTTQRTG
jgi:hypothetical protein